MALHTTEVQKSIFSTLSGDSTLDGLIGNNKILDDVPQGTDYPYVQIGEEDKDGQEYTLTIHIWSRYRGNKETKEIAERIYTLLHNSAISVSGASLANIRNEFFTVLVDDDGLTRHGVMRFRAIVFDN
mgnify:CR=1 FL=1